MEYETSFFDFDYEEIRKLLRQKGGKQLHKMVPFKVGFFQLCGKNDFKDGMIRIRDENSKVTLTTKKFGGKYPEEYEVSVNGSYNDMKEILIAGGLELKSEPDKYREKWSFPDCNEIVFDLWPGIPIVMEIDCTTEAKLHKTCKTLGLDPKNGVRGSKLKHIYGINDNVPNLKFSNYKKLLKPAIKKNSKLLDSLTKKYYQQYVDM